MLGLFGIFGRSHELQRLDQALRGGDQSNLSFLATVCRSRGLFASLHRFGRQARTQACSSARAAR